MLPGQPASPIPARFALPSSATAPLPKEIENPYRYRSGATLTIALNVLGQVNRKAGVRLNWVSHFRSNAPHMR